VRISLHHFAAIGLAVGWTSGITAQTPDPKATETPLASDPSFQTSQADAINNPVADPGAVVVVGKARFTVLTPELIRMEWAADGKFEDHASLVFINRRLPVPEFDRAESNHGHRFTLKTRALTLTYSPTKDGRFTPEDLTIEMTVGGRPVKWRPGLVDDQNLQGTTRTLDGAVGQDQGAD
jgi:alpha-glucosidase